MSHPLVPKLLMALLKLLFILILDLLEKNKQPLPPNRRFQAKFVHIKCRFQKNGNNGEIIPFARNNLRVKFCPVRAAFRIVKRAKRLKHSTILPLAVSQSPNIRIKSCSYLTSKLVHKHLKLAAKSAHGITAAADLKKFTPHSPRVGACVLLHITTKRGRLNWKTISEHIYSVIWGQYSLTLQ